jgi:hypothetical protein
MLRCRSRCGLEARRWHGSCYGRLSARATGPYRCRFLQRKRLVHNIMFKTLCLGYRPRAPRLGSGSRPCCQRLFVRRRRCRIRITSHRPAWSESAGSSRSESPGSPILCAGLPPRRVAWPVGSSGGWLSRDPSHAGWESPEGCPGRGPDGATIQLSESHLVRPAASFCDKARCRFVETR